MERISRGRFYAQIICDVQAVPAIWHCIVQRERAKEVLFWSQEKNWDDALQAADEALENLTQGDEHQAGNVVTIRDKRFMTLRETTQRLRSRR